MRTIDQIKTTTQVVPVSQLRENPLNPRTEYVEIAELGEELKSLQVQSLLVFPSTTIEGDLTVLDGNRRRRAALAADVLYLRCEVMEETPSEAEQLRYIHSAGTTAKNLRQTELANLVQDSFDRLGDDDLVAQQLTRPVEYVRARRLLAKSSDGVKARVDAGQVDAMELLKLDAVAEEFAGTEYAEQVEAYVAAGPSYNGHFDVEGAIAKARQQRDLPEKLAAVQAELKEHKAKVAPDAVRWSGSYLSTSHGGHEAEKAMSVAEHVEAGHVYYVYTSDASVTWYWKRPKAAPVDPNEGLSPEEIAAREAEQAAQDEARAMHAVGSDRRELWLKERFEQKDPLVPLQARVALVRVLMHSVVRFHGTQGKEVLALLTGLPLDSEGWADAVESNLRKRSWSWLASALELSEVQSFGLLKSREFNAWHVSSYTDGFKSLLKDSYGYELFPEEVAVAEYHAAEAAKRCKDCGEPDGTDAEGRCAECAAAELVQHCEECSQAMVGDGSSTFCAQCVADADGSED